MAQNGPFLIPVAKMHAIEPRTRIIVTGSHSEVEKEIGSLYLTRAQTREIALHLLRGTLRELTLTLPHSCLEVVPGTE